MFKTKTHRADLPWTKLGTRCHLLVIGGKDARNLLEGRLGLPSPQEGQFGGPCPGGYQIGSLVLLPASGPTQIPWEGPGRKVVTRLLGQAQLSKSSITEMASPRVCLTPSLHPRKKHLLQLKPANLSVD